jgi:hypothetical protein
MRHGARRFLSTVRAPVAAAMLAGVLTACGDDAPTLAPPKPGKIITVVQRAGMDSVRTMLVGPDGTIYIGGRRGALAYPRKGEERSIYRTANELNGVDGIALGEELIYLSEGDDFTIRGITGNGGVLNVAGNGDSAIPPDGAPAAHSPLACPSALHYDSKTSELLLREGTEFRRIGKDGLIHTAGIVGKTVDELCKITALGLSVADNGDYLFARPTFVVRCCGDIVFYPREGPEASPRAFEQITAMTYDERANAIYVADKTRIKRIAADGTVSVVAGNGSEKFSGDGRPPLETGLGDVRALAVDTKGNLYFVSAFPPGIRVIGAPIR